ncbi:hypothetical protein D3C78_1678430 [compost metagenome]
MQTILGLVEAGLGVALVPDAVPRAGSAVELIPLQGVSDRLLVGTALAVMPDAISATARNFIEQARLVVEGSA